MTSSSTRPQPQSGRPSLTAGRHVHHKLPVPGLHAREVARPLPHPVAPPRSPTPFPHPAGSPAVPVAGALCHPLLAQEGQKEHRPTTGANCRSGDLPVDGSQQQKGESTTVGLEPTTSSLQIRRELGGMPSATDVSGQINAGHGKVTDIVCTSCSPPPPPTGTSSCPPSCSCSCSTYKRPCTAHLVFQSHHNRSTYRNRILHSLFAFSNPSRFPVGVLG